MPRYRSSVRSSFPAPVCQFKKPIHCDGLFAFWGARIGHGGRGGSAGSRCFVAEHFEAQGVPGTLIDDWTVLYGLKASPSRSGRDTASRIAKVLYI